MIFVISGNRTIGKRSKLYFDLAVQTGELDIHIVPGVYSEGLPMSNIAQAHKNVVQKAKDFELPYCVILEDDVLFPVKKKAYQYFIESMKNLPGDWDIYTSGFYTADTIEQDYDNIYRISRFSGLHLYCVNSKFYDRFLTCPAAVNIDQWISQEGIGICFCCYPFAAIQHHGYSENVGREVNYSKLLEGRKIYPDF